MEEIVFSLSCMMNTDLFLSIDVTCAYSLLYCYRPESSYERVPLAVWWLTLQCHAEAVWCIQETERQADGRFTNRRVTGKMKWWNEACCTFAAFSHQGCNNGASFPGLPHLIASGRIWLIHYILIEMHPSSFLITENKVRWLRQIALTLWFECDLFF